VQGEEFLRKECGATLLRVAGIYGPGRNPYRWIRSGRVSLSDKYVNLIHIEDLSEICLAALRCGAPGAAYNVSDGIPRTWREIGAHLDANAGACGQARHHEQQSGKRISTGKLRLLLQQAGISIRHPDLFLSLERLDDGQTNIQP
jgi:nucleoside-diphosphate-sugar epimerase